ncbi:hypothetical protein OG762_21335 [Streptomyces sp. NBC_01136]|nr:hypothetical protein OG762_21335 [Streptomyces sp. NBC_01136]
MLTGDPLDPREILLAIEIVSPSNPADDYERSTPAGCRSKAGKT